MPGSRLPRCPVCGQWLSSDRTVDERVEDHGGAAVWVYRLGCGRCLSVVRVEVPEIGPAARAEAGRPSVDVAGAVAARVLERIAAGAEAAALGSVLDEIAADAERAVLLRIPEVLSRARPAYAAGIRLPRALSCEWPLTGEGDEDVRPRGLLALKIPRPGSEGSPGGVRLHDDAVELCLPAGLAMAVAEFDGGSLLLRPPDGPSRLKHWLADVEALRVWPDLVSPA